MANETLVESWIRRLKNHPVFALVIFAGTAVIAIGAFSDAVLKLKKFAEPEQIPKFAAEQMAGNSRRTIVGDEIARAMLLGKHVLTIQWISSASGEAIVVDRSGLFSIQGEQNDEQGNYVRIEGVIPWVDAKTFTFDGTIVTRYRADNGDAPCTRKGLMTFRISGARRYWRLKEQESPCGSGVDYVDLFFAY